MNIFYISDLHINHDNVIRFDNRPFKNIQDMWIAIRDNWNSKVCPSDTVYILGDFIWSKEPTWSF